MAYAGFVLENWRLKARFPELKKRVGKFMTDPIADMLVRIKNAGAVKKETVAMPFSKVKNEIARVLKQSGFILDFEKRGRLVSSRKLELRLKYLSASFPAISNIARVSKPGRRIYLKHHEIFPKKGGLKIVSTSRGIMSASEARKAKLGGEVLCEIS